MHDGENTPHRKQIAASPFCKCTYLRTNMCMYDVVEAHATVANFLSRYVFEHFTKQRQKEVNSRTFQPRRSSSATKLKKFCI